MKRAITHLGLTLLALGSLTLAGCPPPDTGAPQAILDMEQNVLDLINDVRVAEGIPTLVMDRELRAVARAHSEDMIDRGFFSHTNPDGVGPFQRLAAAGITYAWAGENIARNNLPVPAETAVEGWMSSESHRENLLRPQFNRAGVGVATDGAGGYYFTVDFIGTRAKSCDAEPWGDAPRE